LFLRWWWAVTLPALADTIRLKDGSVIRGQIVSFKNEQFTILVGGGSRGRKSQITVYVEDVESIGIRQYRQYQHQPDRFDQQQYPADLSAADHPAGQQSTDKQQFELSATGDVNQQQSLVLSD
jgi:hypothetical protein